MNDQQVQCLERAEQYKKAAAVCESRNQREQAVELRAQVVEVLVECYGYEHAEVAEALYRQACLYPVKDQSGEGKRLLKEATDLAERTLVDDQPTLVASMYKRLGDVLRHNGYEMDAEQMFQRQTELHRKAGLI
jgi:hypothetical protein